LVDGIGDVVDVQDTIFEAPPETLTGVAKELILGVYKFDEHLLLELDIDAAVELATTAA
jgi:purine-binding chemotaxis protein CheW